MSELKRITVLGAGLMGNGIAQCAAMSGFNVVLNDISEEFLSRGINNIDRSLGRFVKAGKITAQQKGEILQLIKPEVDLGRSVEEAELVIEAVTEDYQIKADIYRIIDKVCPPKTILASNTSQISITALASCTKRPEKFIGMHFFNPPVRMNLVEIVNGVDTSMETEETAVAVCKAMGKETVICKKDSQGFITSRVIQAFLVECLRVLEEGIASPEDIDKACRLAFNHPMGPIELCDFVGLDTLVLANKGLRNAFGDRLVLPETVKRLVDAGHLGVKTGRGFYKHD